MRPLFANQKLPSSPLLFLIMANLNFLSTQFASAATESTPDPSQIAQRQCLNNLAQNPTEWIDARKPVTTGRVARETVCKLGMELHETYTTQWNGKTVTIRQGICNQTFPILQVDIPGEPNFLYIADTAPEGMTMNVFLWNQAYTQGCQGLSGNPNDWYLPTRTQRAHFKFMMAAPYFLRPLATIRRDNGRGERVFATFVDEADLEKSRSCYANTMTGFAFSDSMYINTIFGLTDRDYQDLTQRAQTGTVVENARNQAVNILVRYVFDQPIYPDDLALSAKYKIDLQQRITREQAMRIKDLYKQPGPNNKDLSFQLVKKYVVSDMDWTIVYSDENFRKQFINNNIIVDSAGQLSGVFRSKNQGGGLPIYCITEQSKRAPRAMR